MAVAAAAAVSSGGGREVQGAAVTGRAFNLLEDDSKERVLRLLTAFRNLTSMEQEAFAQFLGVSLPKAGEGQQGLAKRKLGGPALEVRRRDCSYVALAPTVASSFLHENKADATGGANANLGTLVEPFLLEEPLLATDAAQEKDDTMTTPLAIPDSAREPNGGMNGVADGQLQPVETMEGQITDMNAGTHEDTESKEPLVLLRSRAYQALRLARGHEHDAVDEAYTKPRVVNSTGMPFEESDVWQWFDAMDTTRTGRVGVVPFMLYIRELERDFGVPRAIEALFEEEVEALAVDGELTFEQFAFLVSRFPRH